MLYGGRSGEHEISLRSAESIIAGLDPAKYEVQRIFITKEGRWEPRADSRPSRAAIPGSMWYSRCCTALSAKMARCRGLLELADLPYVGAGVLASAVSMDKEVTKRLLSERGLPVVEYLTVSRNDYNVEDICGRLPFPCSSSPRISALRLEFRR